MLAKEDLKRAVADEVDRTRDEIYEIGDTIFRNPESGFKEFKTAALTAGKLREMGLSCREGLAITGVKAKVACGRPGPTVAFLAELDALGVPDHPHADPRTGAAHACGHNGQIAAMLGIAKALLRTGALEQLAGTLVFFAVPAEELAELEYRMALRQEGKLEFLGGKQELIRLGEFDDIDLCLSVHANPRPDEQLAGFQPSNNGCAAKSITFLGKAAHAGSMPHAGINALNAANIALHAIHTQRETFRDHDTVRIHPIITKGGSTVNVVPAEVRIETFVRAKTVEAVQDADAKVDRCLRAGAMAVGAKLKITTIHGYSPFTNHRGLLEAYKQNILPLIGGERWWNEGRHRPGSTDLGDVSLIMPTGHPYNGGASGTTHGADYAIADREVFYINPTKAMAQTIIDIMWDDAQIAREAVTTYRAKFTKADYLAFVRRMVRFEEYSA